MCINGLQKEKQLQLKSTLVAKASRITNVRPAGENAAGQQHQVVTVEGGKGTYRKKPCSNCPWRMDAVGEFPAEAFRHSANTAYDMSDHTFACHQSGADKPAICAGFLLRGAEHNLAIRMKRIRGECLDVVMGDVELHSNYRAMAIANGVDPEDAALALCRD